MTHNTLLSISPLEGRYHEKLNDLRPIFSEFGLMRFRTMIEVRWLQMLATHAHIPELPPFSAHADHLLNNLIENFSEQDAARIKHIEAGINHDVKAVEYFLKEKIENNEELRKSSTFIHFACTSEDINNLAYALMLDAARKQCILPALDELMKLTRQFSHEYAEQAMLSRTHGQPATPTTAGKEIANMTARLQRQIEQLSKAQLLGKMNGASGNYNAHLAACPEIDWQSLSKNFVMQFNLAWNAYTTQIEPHDYMSEFFAILIRINTILINLSRDMWGYLSLNYFQLKKFNHEVGSSTMPHKVNPIDFENAEGNLGIANALLEHMCLKLPISRWQRDLSDSTVMRNIGVAVGHAILGIQSIIRGLTKVKPNADMLIADLNQHWEVLAEPIQTILRRNGVTHAYEQLKSFTRGHALTQETLHEFIATLDVSEDIKKQLYQLTPENYLGYAGDLAKRI